MHNYKLFVSYDGRDFHGWQKSSGYRTVEEVLQETIEKKLQHPVVLQAASRTDAGVHAVGQVVNFFSPLSFDGIKFCLSMNRLLPDDLRLTGAEEAPFSFHPTLDNTGKEYRYKIQLGIYQNPLLRHCAWHVYYPVDLSIVVEAAKTLQGTHDFEAFCNHHESSPKECTIRTIHSITVHEHDSYIEIRIMGDNFLYKMVRNIVGTLIDIGRGKLAIEELPKILQQKNRIYAGVTAPAHGLTLQRLFFRDQQRPIPPTTPK